MHIYGKRGVDGIEPVAGVTPSTQPEADDLGKSEGDSVTLSPDARARESAARHPRFGAFSQRAHVDPEFADEMAYAYSHMDDGPLYDMRAWDGAGTGPSRYSATGEVVTPESEARYRKLAASHEAASRSLYDAEKAKGTDPADIFDKLIALLDSQPEDYRSFIDWEGKTA